MVLRRQKISNHTLDQRLVMYRFSKSRSASVGGTGRRREKRKAEFGDSRTVVVDSSSDNGRHGEITAEATVDEAWDMAEPTKTGFARLDQATLQHIGWTSGALEDRYGGAIKDVADEFYKLTKAEFKRLQEQVRDVSLNLRNKFRTSAYQMPPCDQPGCKFEVKSTAQARPIKLPDLEYGAWIGLR